MRFGGHKFGVEGEEKEKEEKEGLQPLPLNSWEIPEKCIIMDTMF